MNIDHVFDSLKIKEFQGKLSFSWDESEKTYPGADLPFISEPFIRKTCIDASLDSSVSGYLTTTLAGIIRNAPALSRLMWHQYHLLYECKEGGRPSACDFPMLENCLGDKAYGYNLVLALAGLPKAVDFYNSLGIPAQIGKDTFSDLAVWCSRSRELGKGLGLSVRILHWLQNHISGSLFKLGRLQFIHTPFKYPISVWRNLHTGETAVLSNAGIRINGEGLIDGVEGNFDNSVHWETTLEENDEFIAGCPVSPAGFIENRKRVLLKKEWVKELSHGCGVLDVHIPATGPMTVEACADSFDKADKFFPRYFPDSKFEGFVCSTWFFDPHFAAILPESSNIMKFQHGFHLLPTPDGGHKETISRVFGIIQEGTPYGDYPRNTSMQKTFAGYLQSGGTFRSAGGFYLRKDLPYARGRYKQ